MCISGHSHIINRKLHEEYGDIVRVAPNQISVKGEIGWKAIYSHKLHGEEEWAKGDDFFSGVPPDIVTAATPDHRRLRKEIIRAFSDKAIQEQLPKFRQYSTLLLQRWRDRDQTVLDISRWLNFYTFDIFGDLAFGEPFGSLESGESHKWIDLIFDTIVIGKNFRFLDEFKPIKALVMYFIPESVKRRAADHYELSVTKIKKRLARGVGDRHDFISYIMKTDGTGLTETEMERNASTLIVAGSETTATTLSALIYFLLTNPAKYARLIEEIHTAFKSDDEITLQSSSALPYLQGCVEEALRLFPAVPIGAPRQVPKGGGYLNELWLPERTLIEVPQWATHRSEVNFHNPDDFAPERWLPPTHAWYEEQYQNDKKSNAQTFSYGPRSCLGKNLAYYEMRFTISRILRNFDFELQPEAKNWIERCESYFFWHKPPLPVKVIART